MPKKGNDQQDEATRAFEAGLGLATGHPVFRGLGRVIRKKDLPFQASGLAWVTNNGDIRCNPRVRASAAEWAYAIAHCKLHLAFDHFRVQKPNMRAWQAACDAVCAQFLADLKFGAVAADMPHSPLPTVRDEERLYQQYCNMDQERLPYFGVAGPESPGMVPEPERPVSAFHLRIHGKPRGWPEIFAENLVDAVTSAVSVAAGEQESLTSNVNKKSAAMRAKNWFVSTYPLLGSLAASFDLVEDPLACHRMDISVAAVNEYAREIYVNPAARLTDDELKFVLAHEFLHVGLRHQARRDGRDPFLWNVACDFVINDWLVQMQVGAAPAMGLLYDPELRGESAESIYDRLAQDLRRARKLATLKGHGMGDMLGPEAGGAADTFTDLDAFYRRQLAQGLEYHQAQGRGLLPASLVEEIRALDQPPVPWDVELAKWFQNHFQPIERKRSYARLSRRQSASPDIPRPAWVTDAAELEGRTFGVVLDTSGSMDRQLLAKALGAIASYSVAHDVPAARVIFCDAVAYDAGYMPPEAIAERVRIKGRGGTVLQPGIDFLERAKDFPEDGPVLIITDAECDRLSVRREHAYLIPQGKALPFPTRAPVFRMR